MAAAGHTAYDDVPYPARPFPRAHPDRLASIAALLGLAPPPVTACSMVEIGCSDGGHLLPLAATLPGSRFAGIDLAPGAIAAGKAAAAALELTNLELVAANLLDWDPGPVQFDYIVAHGLYSWVPPAVRERLMQFVAERLSPNGVAYISYNTYPGCFLRKMMAGMMHRHVDRFESPADKIAQVRELMKFLIVGQTADTPVNQVIREEAQSVLRAPEATVFHDDLSEWNEPVYFDDFGAHAARHGLEYLAEADYFTTTDTALPEQIRALLAGMPFLDRQQYIDFVRCRRFRSSLLVRSGAAIERTPSPRRVAGFLIATPLKPKSEHPSLEPGVLEEFVDERALPVAIDHPLSKAALMVLAESWPRALPFAELLARAAAMTGGAPDEEHVEGLQGVLLRAYSAGMIEFHTHQPHICTAVTERPVAPRFAREEARRGSQHATTLRHTAVYLDDPVAAALLPLLDGTRDHAALAAELEVKRAAGAFTLDTAAPMLEIVEGVLRMAARQALLEG